MYLVLAPFDNEQSDLVHRIHQDIILDELPVYRCVIVIILLYITTIRLHCMHAVQRCGLVTNVAWCVCVCVCVRACVRACVHVCVSACLSLSGGHYCDPCKNALSCTIF